MMMPDVNLLVAYSSETHEAHQGAVDWFRQNSPIATCAITELGMLRVLIQLGTPIQTAEIQLARVIARHRKLFVQCDLSAEVLKGKLLGYRQITDLYLLALCELHSMKLATLDKGIPGATLVAAS